jgi:membrane-bound lytic murein transglycosylase MltF
LLALVLRPQWFGPDRHIEDGALLDRRLGPLARPWTGDLPDIRAGRRFLRVLVSYAHPEFYVDGGDLRGLEYEMMRAFEEHLNAGAARAARAQDKLALVFVPGERGELLAALGGGLGDVVAAGLIVPGEPEPGLAYSRPYMTGVALVVVEGPGAAPLAGLDDLAGRTVYVEAGGPGHDAVADLGRALEARGLAGVRVRRAEDYMRAGDVLELVQAGVWPRAVVELHLARVWAEALPGLRVREDLAVRDGLALGWAVRAGSPELLRALDAFAATVRQGSFLGNVLQRRYLAPEALPGAPPGQEDMGRLREMEPYLRGAAERYGFDWLRLAALAYQESRLDQGKVSPAGAVGVMQLLPATARAAGDGADIATPEGNILAGAAYLAHLRDEVFAQAGLEPAARMNFALAAYNAGPTRIQQLRREAPDHGLDPDRWFGAVEHLAARSIGRETVEYVLGVNKNYFILAGLAGYMARQEERR